MSLVREGVAAAFDVAATRPLLAQALLRHAHELDYLAGRTRDGTLHDLLVEDRERVLRRIEAEVAA